ncbi:MAG: hypothetical protein R6U21_03150 [Thermoplasmatota archaeon]
MNREAGPLLVGLMIPLLLVSIIFLQLFFYDVFGLLNSIDPLYYIMIFPIALGLMLALLNRGE